jgi:ATP-binding cassette subfamily A (ABC1) protein 3
LVDSATKFAATQYGAIYFTHDLTSEIVGGGVNFSDAVVAACLQNKVDYLSDSECENYAGIGYVIQYNFSAIHGTPLYQNLADQAILREALDDDNLKIKTTIHPLPQTSTEANLGEAGDAFSSWFLIILSFPFITGSFATFVVAERQSKAKHLQTVAGVKPVSYWFSTWLWDVTNYQLPMWVTIILMFAFKIDVMTTTDRGVLGGVLALLILFGPAAASYTYCVSFLFSSPSICNLFIIISSFLIGMGGTLASYILRLIGSDTANPSPSLVDAAKIMEWILRFIPAFNLSKGLFNAINIDTFEYLEGKPLTVWHDSVLLIEVIFLACQTVVYLVLAMKIDEWSSNPKAVSIWRGFVSVVTCQFLCNSSYGYGEGAEETPEDNDVIAEQERVLSGGANNDLIVLSQLSKVYDNGKKAVNNMSLGIPPGQCFGLLGINGAGM